MSSTLEIEDDGISLGMSERPIRTSRSPLYWSHFQDYEKCGQMFLWRYGWEGYDLGSGVGNPKSVPQDKSEHHALLGSVIQKVVEDITNGMLWKHPLGIEDRIRNMIFDTFGLFEEKDKFFLTKDSPSKEELSRDAFFGVKAWLKTARVHGWLKEGVVSEMKIMATLSGVPIGAKVDFLVPDGETHMILDGKNTLHRMKYTDPDQLRFYHLVYSLANGKDPSKLGLVWFRFPYDAESGEQGVDWVPCSERDIEGLKDRIKKTFLSMVKGEFDAKPVPKVCSKCAFESVCEPRQAQRRKNAEKRTKGGKKIVHLNLVDSPWFSLSEEDNVIKG